MSWKERNALAKKEAEAKKAKEAEARKVRGRDWRTGSQLRNLI
jgi:hypothetical protein